MEERVVDGVRYRPIAGYPGYWIGEDGTVYGTRCYTGEIRSDVWNQCRTEQNHKGRYLRVGLRAIPGGKPKTLYVHRLVMNAFVGQCPEGMECLHGDGDAGNCLLDNLSWGPRTDNAEDRRRHGTMPMGSNHKNSKLTEDQVREMRQLAAQGMSQRLIGLRYGIQQGSVSAIVLRKVWKHVI